MVEILDSNQRETIEPAAEEFVSPEKRPVAPGLTDYNDGRPVATGVEAGGDPNAKIVPERYPARG